MRKRKSRKAKAGAGSRSRHFTPTGPDFTRPRSARLRRGRRAAKFTPASRPPVVGPEAMSGRHLHRAPTSGGEIDGSQRQPRRKFRRAMVGRHGGENDDSFTTHVSYRRLPRFAAYCHNRRERRRTGNDHRVRRGEHDRCSGQAGPAVQQAREPNVRYASPSRPRPRSPDRSRRGHRRTSSSRPTRSGWTTSPPEDLIVTATRVSPVGNRGDDRHRRQPARGGGDRPPLGHRCTDRPRREDRHRRSDQCSGRHVSWWIC